MKAILRYSVTKDLYKEVTFEAEKISYTQTDKVFTVFLHKLINSQLVDSSEAIVINIDRFVSLDFFDIDRFPVHERNKKI